METALGEPIPPPLFMVSEDEHDTIAHAVADVVAGTVAAQLFTPGRIRALRRYLGLHQSQLAEMLGVTQVHVSHAELGTRSFSPALALKLARLAVILCEGSNALESISALAVLKALSAPAPETNDVHNDAHDRNREEEFYGRAAP